MSNSKQELGKIVQENKTSLVGETIFRLLEIMLQEAREKNDKAKGADIFVNQGEIEAYKNLMNIFSRKPSPSPN